MSLPDSEVVTTQPLPSNYTSKTYHGRWWHRPVGRITTYVDQEKKEFQPVIDSDANTGNATIMCTYDESGQQVGVRANCFGTDGKATRYVLAPRSQNCSITCEGNGRIQSNLARPGDDESQRESRPLVFMKGYEYHKADSDQDRCGRDTIKAEVYVEAKGDVDSRVSVQAILTYVDEPAGPSDA